MNWGDDDYHTCVCNTTYVEETPGKRILRYEMKEQELLRKIQGLQQALNQEKCSHNDLKTEVRILRVLAMKNLQIKLGIEDDNQQI